MCPEILGGKMMMFVELDTQLKLLGFVVGDFKASKWMFLIYFILLLVTVHFFTKVNHHFSPLFGRMFRFFQDSNMQV